VQRPSFESVEKPIPNKAIVKARVKFRLMMQRKSKFLAIWISLVFEGLMRRTIQFRSNGAEKAVIFF
jgi:hypothetical protein